MAWQLELPVVGLEWHEVEARRYDSMYRDRNYPAGDPMRVIKHFGYGEDWKCLDVGCGHATLAEYFTDYTGVDVSPFAIKRAQEKYPATAVLSVGNEGMKCEPSMWRRFHVASAHDLSCIKDDRFDVCVISDVMEHIPPDQVMPVLAEIASVNARVFAFNICTRPSFILDSRKENLHPTVWPAQQWIEAIMRFFTNIVTARPQNDCVLIECTSTPKQP